MGRTAGFQASDFDRIVRHGVKPGGHPALMPSVDFYGMSDQELSDIIVYLRALPPVDSLVPAPTLGPLGRRPSTVISAVVSGRRPRSARWPPARMPRPPPAAG